jgi:hypothetical protein
MKTIRDYYKEEGVMRKLFIMLFVAVGVVSLLVAQHSPSQRVRPNETIVVAKQAFRNQIGPIPETTLFVPKSDGDFRVSIYLEGPGITEPFPNNELAVTVAWADDFREACDTEVDLTGPTSEIERSSTGVIHATANNPIFVSGSPTACSALGTTDTSDSYSAFITVEEMP